jgi:predicted N-acetyltransferase YhbS
MTTIRPLRPEDVPAVAEVQLAANRAADEQAGRDWTPPDETRRARFRRTLDRFAAVDAGTSFVAEVDGAVVGHAVAIRRGAFWGLSLLFVHPDHQSAGVGRRLMEAVTPGADEAQLAMIMSSEDPRAIRRYARAGFDLHPAVKVEGRVDPDAVPPDLPVRRGGDADLDVVDAVDEPLRGSSRRPDVEFLLREGEPLWVAESGDGYAMASRQRVIMLGARDSATARALLWRMLAEMVGFEEEVDAYCWTATQQWAIEVAVAAKLRITPAGPLFVRGGPVPGPYLPSGIYF